MSRPVKLFCIVHGDSGAVPFDVPTNEGETVSELKKLIKNAKSPEFNSFAPDRLKLWKWNKAIDIIGDLNPNDALDPRVTIGEVFEGDPPRKRCTHIIITVPSSITPSSSEESNIAAYSSSMLKRSSEGEDDRSKKRLKESYSKDVDKMVKLYEQIQELPDEPENYSDPNCIYQLPFPSVNPIPSRFSRSDNKISYMGRQCFIQVWKEFLQVQRDPDYRQAIYVYGCKGFGKSHIFAALACLLIRRKYPVVYIPDCRGMLRKPWRYLVTAFRFAFISSPEILESIEKCNTLQSLEKFCDDYREKGQLCFIIDQQNAMDPKPMARGDVPDSTKVELMTLLQRMTYGHIEITSASANHKTFIHMAAKDTGEQKIHLMGGMTKYEVSCWWKHHDFKAFSPKDKQRVEDLTGCIPLLLNPFVIHCHQTLESLEPQIWNDPRLESVLKETIDFAKAKKSELAQNTFRDDYLSLMHNCLTGQQISGSAPHIDHRYFYLDSTSHGRYSCGLARQAMTEFLRINADEGVFLGPEWHQTLENFKDNPSVIGFTVEQMVISRIASSGIKSELRLPPAKIITFPGDIIRLSNAEGQSYYVPLKFNQKAIDALFVSVDQKKKSAHVVGIQITVAKNHKDSESAFYADLKKWLVGLEGLDVKTSFIWIHDGERGKAEVEEKWVSIDQVDADLARTLARIWQT